MAEVGLLPFARIALHVAKAVLPRYRSRFSKHQFTQPQLLAILSLMRYEDWTFREAEVRLGEHRELCQALGLASVPDFTTLYRPHLHSEAAGRAQCDSRQAWEENLARAWRARGDAPSISVPHLPAPCADRERILFGQTQALGASPRPQPAHASAPSPAARPEFQSVPLEASSPFPEDVNRARQLLESMRHADAVETFAISANSTRRRIGSMRSARTRTRSPSFQISAFACLRWLRVRRCSFPGTDTIA